MQPYHGWMERFNGPGRVSEKLAQSLREIHCSREFLRSCVSSRNIAQPQVLMNAGH
jgi:hypothetical protein